MKGLLENLNLKLLSLAAALVLYSLVHSTQDVQRTVVLNVAARVPPKEGKRLLVTQIPPISVTVRGPRSLVEDLNADSLGNLPVDLRDGRQARLAFNADQIHVPPGVKVEQISPQEVELAWEDIVVRDVPIQAVLVGVPSPGFMVRGSGLLEPSSVRVTGPKSEVLVLQHARTDAFEVKDLTAGKYTRQLALAHPQSARIEFEPQSTQVTVEVIRELSERTFPKLAVAVVGSVRARTQPAEVDVKLRCPPDTARLLRAEQVVPRVRASGTGEHGSELLPVELGLEGCEATMTPSVVITKW